jgi:hypothetical protein
MSDRLRGALIATFIVLFLFYVPYVLVYIYWGAERALIVIVVWVGYRAQIGIARDWREADEQWKMSQSKSFRNEKN